MEKSIVVAGDHQRTDSSPGSKSAGSLVKIDSISIDLINADDKSDAGKCEHFSIRGYVSEIRNKDRKICWPFAIDENDNMAEVQTCLLPPLHVPKFRWWRCKNCLQEFDAPGAIKNNEIVPYHSPCGFKSNGTCSYMSSHVDAVMLQPDLHQAPKSSYVEDGKVDANSFTSMTNNKDHPLHSDEKERESEVEHITLTERENGLNNDMNQENATQTCIAAEANPCMMQEKHTNGTVTPESKCDGSVEVFEPGFRSHKVANAEVATRSDKCPVAESAEIFQRGKENSVDSQKVELPLVACQMDKAASIVEEEPNCASFDSAEIVIGDNLLSNHQDKSNGAYRKKSRKVRLLTELLGENGGANTDCMRTADSPSNAIFDISSRQGTVSVPQGPVAVQGNVRRGFMGQNRKKKLPRDEEWRPPEMSSLNNVNKKVRAFKENAETTKTIATSESEDDVFIGIDLQIGMNSLSTKQSVEKQPTLSRRNKKTQIVDDCLSLAPARESALNENQGEIGNTSKHNAANDVLFTSPQDTFTDRGMDPLPLHAQRMKRKPSWCENESKTPQVDDGLASLIPFDNITPIEDLDARKDIEFMQTENSTLPVQSGLHASTGKGLELSLNSYLTVPRYDEKYDPQVEGGLPSSLPWQEGKIQVVRKDLETKYIGDSSVLSKSYDGTYGKGVNRDCSRKGIIYRMPFLNEKQNLTSQVEERVGSAMQKMVLSNPSNNEKTIEHQEHLAVTKKHSDQRGDKISEQGALDDIPMEIVELMAKNQYERCLHDAENQKHPLKTKNDRSAQIMDFAEVSGNRELRSVQKEATQKRKPRAKNGRNCIRTTGENVEPTKQKVDYFSHSNRSSQLKQTHGLTGFSTYSQCHGNPSSEAQFHAASSSGHRSAQSSKWNADLARLGIGSFNSSMQSLGATRPQQSKEAASLWSPIIPNHIPFGFHISQTCEAQCTNVDILSRHPSSLHKSNLNEDHALKFLNASAANLRRHSKKFCSETLSRTHPDCPFAGKHNGTELPKKMMGSLDLYSNETIPAMHLLSLMDAGVRSGTATSVDETQKLLKKPFFSQDHNSKEFSAQQVGVSQEYFPAIQIGGASAYSFQQNRSFRKATDDFTSQVSLKCQQKGKAKMHETSTRNGSNKSQKSALTCGGSGKNDGAVSVHSSQKRFLGDSDSSVFPFQSLAIGNSTRKKKMDAHITNGTVWPLKSDMETALCSVNRNPADFTMPGARNAFMIKGEDLKFRKAVHCDDGSVHNKRQRNMKLNAAKESAQD